jgi:LysR family transcriptional regulator, regulator for metE and metH
LLGGEVDLAILNSKGENRDLIYLPLVKDEIVLLVHPSHRLACRSFVRPDDLASEVLLLQSTHNNRNAVVDEFLDPAGIFPASVQFLQLTEAIIEMVKAEMVVSALARWMILPHVQAKSVSAIRLGRGGLRRDWRVAFRDGDPQPEELTRACTYFSQHLNRLRKITTSPYEL